MLALLPFDTLLMQAAPEWRAAVARAFARTVEAAAPSAPAPSPHPDAMDSRAPLRVAYLSRDWLDHPTAHMAEGALWWHNRSRVHPLAATYGPNDHSAARHRAQRHADAFVDLHGLDNDGTQRGRVRGPLHGRRCPCNPAHAYICVYSGG